MLILKCLVEFSSEAFWSRTFLCGGLITASISLLVIDLFRFFLFLHNSILVGCVFLGIYQLLLGYPFCWHITVHICLLPSFLKK